MNYINTFEDFKYNNQDSTLITIDDIIKCIKLDGLIFSDIVDDYPNDVDKDIGYKPVDIDNDGLITVIIDNNEYTIKLNNVIKIETYEGK